MTMVFGGIWNILNKIKGKKTSEQKLEELDKEIKEYEKSKRINEYNEKKYIGALVLYSIVLYIVGALVYYIYFWPSNLVDRIKTLMPFLVSPLVVYLMRRFLKWFFIKRQTYYEAKLRRLQEEKHRIIDEVKENETYKKATEILKRFSSSSDLQQSTPPGSPKTPPNNNQAPKAASTEAPNNLVHRNVPSSQMRPHQQQPPQRPVPFPPNTMPRPAATMQLNGGELITTPAPPGTIPPMQLSLQTKTVLPRPIVPQNRSILDKLLDFMIGEGPNNRYALICKNCHFHNGMALKEEFEYVAFRCAYCLFYNEARKTKLTVPKRLSNLPEQQTSLMSESMSSSTLSNNNNDTEDDKATTEAAPVDLSQFDSKKQRSASTSSNKSTTKDRKQSTNKDDDDDSEMVNAQQDEETDDLAKLLEKKKDK